MALREISRLGLTVVLTVRKPSMLFLRLGQMVSRSELTDMHPILVLASRGLLVMPALVRSISLTLSRRVRRVCLLS